MQKIISISTKKSERDSDSEGSDIPSEYEEHDGDCSTDLEEILTQAENGWIGYNEFTSTSIPPSAPDFKGNAGVKVDLTKLKEPIEFFDLFLGDKFLEDVCNYTHIYYKVKAEKGKKRRDSHQRKWNKPDLIEMRAFLGALLYTGILKKPNYRDYWAESILFSTPGFTKIFSRDHFLDLKRNLHFVDEKYANPSDPLYKIRPLIDKVIQSSQKLYSPKQFLTIDECMIRFSGRSQFKVYMPLKPIKYGFKAYLLTEATSGYVLQWKLHEAAKSTQKKLSPLKQIIYSLIENYQELGHVLCMDRFYTTLAIAKDLPEKGFGCIGAIMANRLSLTSEMKKELETLAMHESLFYIYKSSLVLSCWKDSKIVQVISTYGQDYYSSISRNAKDKEGKHTKKEVNCPLNIQTYTKYARGVDYFDQMISYYEIKHKSRKWYTRLVLHFLQLAAHNSFILFSKMTDTKKDYLEYLKDIIKSLVYKMRQRNLAIETPVGKRKNESIEPTLDESDCKLGYGTKRKCQICLLKGQDKKMSYQCFKHSLPVCVLHCYDVHRNNVDLCF